MNISEVFENNKKWVHEKLDSDAQYFDNLSKGQSPELLYIGCSDSRVSPTNIMGVQPGEAFVHRNIANLVPNTDLNTLSVINYAVFHLKVKHVIICGHYNCGGVLAAMKSDNLGVLNPWIKNIKDVYRTHKTTLNAIEDESTKYKRLVELNVQEQCINVLKIPEVQQAFNNKNIKVHGWVFDISSGQLVDLKIDFDEILKNVAPIYKMD
jgi:carbonic anhydrase